MEGTAVASSLVRSIASVGGYTLVSRVFGLVRDLVLARVFGADAATDAFFVAFKVPNFLRRLFGEGAFATAFVPVLSEYRLKRSFAELKLFVDHVAGTLGLVLVPASLVGSLGAPLLVSVFGAGFLIREQGETFWLASAMLSLTFTYLLFIVLTGLAGSILNAHNRFAVPAFTPVLLNLCMIASALWLAPHMQEPITALAWGVVIAGLVQLGFQLPFLRRLDLLPRFRPAPRDPGVRRVLALMGPALFGVSVTQLNLLMDTLVASFLAGGSISWLYYSDRLVEFPLGILGVALGTVILPTLSRCHAEAAGRAFAATLDWGLRWLVLFGLPSALGLSMLAGPVIATLLQSAAFDATDVVMAQRSLWAYSLGLVGFMGVKALAPGFYARQDTRTPVRFGVVSMLVNMSLNLILVWPLGHAGLALATSLAACLNAGLLLWALAGAGWYRPEPGWAGLLVHCSLGLLVMGAVLFWGSPPLVQWLAWDDGTRILRLSGLIGLGALGYFAAFFFSGGRLRHFGPPV
jgi:putative peptidoglycan lipid II flippase